MSELRDIMPDDAGVSLLAGAEEPEGVLLPYQARVNDRIKHPGNSVSHLPLLLVIEKSRRIGITWGIAMVAAMTIMAKRSGGGQNVYYMSYNLETCREFIEVCAHWLEAFNIMAVEIEETVFTGDDPDKDIKAFRITLPTGFSIISLPSSARVLRGKQGLVFLDEAAFLENLAEVLKAALALIIWGAQVIVCSTHQGEENAFNTLIEEMRAGKRNGEVIKITFDDALADGLYKRICEVRKIEWTPEGEEAWKEEVRAIYGDGASEELDVIPSRGSGAVLPRALIKSRMTKDFEVVRITLKDNYVHLPAPEQRALFHRILAEQIDPHIAALDPERKHGFGQDFARNSDLSVLSIGREAKDMRLEIPLVIEMRNVPFKEQEMLLEYVGLRLPRFVGGKLDARGNGQALAEFAQRKFGYNRIEAVMTTDKWYIDNMPPFIARFSDGDISLPADDLLSDDLVALKRIRGVIKLDATRQTKAGVKRHGDFAISGCLTDAAMRINVLPIEGHGVGLPRASDFAFADGAIAGSRIQTTVGFGSVTGRPNSKGF